MKKNIFIAAIILIMDAINIAYCFFRVKENAIAILLSKVVTEENELKYFKYIKIYEYMKYSYILIAYILTIILIVYCLKGRLKTSQAFKYILIADIIFILSITPFFFQISSGFYHSLVSQILSANLFVIFLFFISFWNKLKKNKV